jgi:hypothetical protein
MVSKLWVKCGCNALSERGRAYGLGVRRSRGKSSILKGAPAVLLGRAFQPVVDRLMRCPLRIVLSRALQLAGLEHLVDSLRFDREYLRGAL